MIGSFELSVAASSEWIESNGAFTASLKGSRMPQSMSGTGDVVVKFNAALSNSTYGASTKVQTRGLQALIIIKA